MKRRRAGAAAGRGEGAGPLGRLDSAGDGLTRPEVEALIARGPAIVPALVKRVRGDAAWEREGRAAWAPVHATFALAGIAAAHPTDAACEALEGVLIAAARHEVREVLDTAGAWLSQIGVAIHGPLLRLAANRFAEPAARAAALQGLCGCVARGTLAAAEAVRACRTIADHPDEDPETQDAARACLEALDQGALGAWTADPLAPYDPGAKARAAARAEAAADAAVTVAALRARDEGAWNAVAAGVDAFADAAAPDDPDGQLLASDVAQAMADMAVEELRRAPWEWDPWALQRFLLGRAVRSLRVTDPARIDRVPDLALGFVQFWAVRGKVEPEVAEACTAHLETLRVEFAKDARDPMKWAWAKRMFAALDAAAIDRTDPDAVAAFVERYRAAHPPEEEGDGPDA